MYEGIKNNINWSAEDIEFCGDASDGEWLFFMFVMILVRGITKGDLVDMHMKIRTLILKKDVSLIK